MHASTTTTHALCVVLCCVALGLARSSLAGSVRTAMFGHVDASHTPRRVLSLVFVQCEPPVNKIVGMIFTPPECNVTALPLQMCNYTCSAGYSLTGSASRFCLNRSLADGGPVFTGTLPRCDSIINFCNVTVTVQNGTLATPATQLGLVERVRCNPGYGFLFDPLISCVLSPNGISGAILWNGTLFNTSFVISCPLNDSFCPVPIAWSNATYLPSVCPRSLGAQCTLLADPGYDTTAPGSQSASSTCVIANGTGAWAPAYGIARKTARYCATPGAPFELLSNQCVNATLGSKCVFSCIFGFTLANCTQSCNFTCAAGVPGVGGGIWSGLQCLPAPCPTLVPPPYTLVANSTGNFTGGVAGTIVNVTCMQGYDLMSGLGPVPFQAVMCSPANLNWTPLFLPCVPKPCTPLVPPAFGYAVANVTGVTGQSREIRCNLGYYVTPSQGCNASTEECWALRYCQPSGLFNNSAVQCLPIACPPLPAPSNGSFSSSTGPAFSSSILTCNQGYRERNGTVRTNCLPNNFTTSLWSTPLPECEPNQCILFEPPANGFIDGPPNAKPKTLEWRITRCDSGYRLILPDTPTDPGYSCDPITSECTLARQCLIWGNWSASEPICEPLPCPALTAIGNSSYSNLTGQTRDLVDVTCFPGFALVGSFQVPARIACTAVPGNFTHSRWAHFSGLVSGDELPLSGFACLQQVCNESIISPSNGLAFPFFGAVGDVAQYQCNAGFQRVGSATRTCLPNQTWSGMPASCLARLCLPNMTNPANGVFAPLFGVTFARSTLTCNVGWHVASASDGVRSINHTCLTSSVWHPLVNASLTGSCAGDACVPLMPPANGFIIGAAPGGPASGTTGVSRSIRCNPAYELYESASSNVLNPLYQRTCQPDHSWAPGPPDCRLIQKYCPPLAAPPNGTLFRPAGEPDCAQVLGSTCGTSICNRGFQRSGSGLSTCVLQSQDTGVWQTDILCSPCPRGDYAVVQPGTPDQWTCAICPMGGVCLGGDKEPYAEDGWWRNPETDTFLTCVPASTCVGGACRRGHTGFKCIQCEIGYYKKDGELCVTCPPSKQIVYPLFLVLAVLLCLMLVRLARRSTHYFASLSVGISFLQIIAILPSYKVAWPPIAKTFFRLLAPLSLDISSLFEPQCVVSRGQTPFVVIWYLKVSLPLIFAGIFVLGAGVTLGYHWLSNRLCHRSTGASTGALGACRKCCLTPLSTAKLRLLLWSCVNAFLTCCVLSYIVVLSAALSVYGCTRQRDGTVTMDAEPAITCTSLTWRRLVTVSVFVSFFFGLGFPAGVLYVLRVRRYSLWKDKNIVRFGLLYQRYVPGRYLYEIVLLGRKFLFVFGKAVFPMYPVAQLAWAMAVVLAGAVLQQRIWPFRDRMVNALELTHLLCAVVVLLFGVIFGATSSSMSARSRNGMAWFMISLIVVNIVLMSVAVVLAIRRVRALVARGVMGGIASDSVTVHPPFISCDMRLLARKRMTTPHASLLYLALSVRDKSAAPADQSGARFACLLEQLDRGLGASAVEVLHPVDSAPARYARVYQPPRCDYVLAWFLAPCRGTYSAHVALARAEAHGAAEAVVDFFFATESGCLDERQELVQAAALHERGGCVLSPVERVLTARASCEFTITCPGLAQAFVSFARSPAELNEAHARSAGQPLFNSVREADALSVRTASIELPAAGVVGVWGEFPDARSRDSAQLAGSLALLDSQPGSGTELANRMSRAMETLVLLAVYDIADEPGDGNSSDEHKSSVDEHIAITDIEASELR